MADYERSLRRKFREMLLACLVADIVPKADIPGLYLSVAYYGWRMNGLAEACERLGMDLNLLTEAQAARLVASLKYPEPRFASSARMRKLQVRATYILSRLPRDFSLHLPNEMRTGQPRAILEI